MVLLPFVNYYYIVFFALHMSCSVPFVLSLYKWCKGQRNGEIHLVVSIWGSLQHFLFGFQWCLSLGQILSNQTTVTVQLEDTAKGTITGYVSSFTIYHTTNLWNSSGVWVCVCIVTHICLILAHIESLPESRPHWKSVSISHSPLLLVSIFLWFLPIFDVIRISTYSVLYDCFFGLLLFVNMCAITWQLTKTIKLLRTNNAAMHQLEHGRANTAEIKKLSRLRFIFGGTCCSASALFWCAAYFAEREHEDEDSSLYYLTEPSTLYLLFYGGWYLFLLICFFVFKASWVPRCCRQPVTVAIRTQQSECRKSSARSRKSQAAAAGFRPSNTAKISSKSVHGRSL